MNHIKQIVVFFVSLLMIGSAITIVTANNLSNGSVQHQPSLSPEATNTSAKAVLRSFSAQLSELKPFSPQSNFRFEETGLPTGTQWSVSLGNTTFETRNSSISFSMASGSYNYSVSNSLNFFSPQSTGIINTSNAIQIVHYYGYLHTAGYVNLSSGVVSQNPGLNFNNFVIPYGLFNNYSHSIIVASNANNSILSLNASDYRINGFLTIDGSPGGLALNPNGTIYITTVNQLVIVSKNMRVEAYINVSYAGVKSVAYNEFSGLIFVGTYSNGTYIFNSTTLKLVNHMKNLDVLSTQGIAINKADHMTLVADFLNNSIWFIKGSTPVSYLSLPVTPISILPEPNSNNLLLSSFPVTGYSLFFLNVSTRSLHKIGNVSWGMAITFDSETGSPFVSDIASNGIVPINYQLLSGLGSLRTSYEPYFVIFDPITNTIVSGGIYSNSLSLMNFSMVPVNLTFSESGLSKGATWGIEINGYKAITSETNLSLQVLPGMVNYTVIMPAGYTTNTTGYTMVTSGISNVTIRFHRLYSVNFLETGLPTNITQWSIDLNGKLYSSIGNIITLNLTAGNYTYFINSTSVYKPALSLGKIEINGNVNITVAFSTTLYAIKFVSRGLPSGYAWSARIDDRLFYTNTSYLMVNVTYGELNFTINPLPGYIPSPNNSTITVSSNDTIINISWSPVLFKVKIMDRDLPMGVTWGISIGNISRETSTSAIEIYEPNGTFMIHPFTSSGNYSSVNIELRVKGANVDLNVTFSPVLYNVQFITQNYRGIWYVNLSNGKFSGPISGSSYTFALLNGSYSFRTAISNKIYRPSSSSGSFTVNGASLLKTVNFIAVNYTVTFNEKGLPSGTAWYINLSNGLDSGKILGHSYNFTLTNGSYTYLIKSSDNEFQPINASGSFMVSGSKADVLLSFIEITFRISLDIVNLPAGTSWSLFVNGSMYGDNIITNNYSILLPNGTYSIDILPSSREYYPSHFVVDINGHNVSKIVSLDPVLYKLIVNESNLPNGTVWFLSISNGSIFRSTSSSIELNLMNGTYNITYGTPDHIYKGSELTVMVNGFNESVEATFMKVTFGVSFNISGQYIPKIWNLTISGNGVVGPNHGNVTIYLSNGTYNFTADPLNTSWYSLTGSLKVNGSSITVLISFKPVLYNVAFIIVSPSHLKRWNLEITNYNYTISGNSFNISLQNGTYLYIISGMRGYDSYTSYVKIAGKNQTLDLIIPELEYRVVFRNNLKDGIEWNISISNIGKYSSSSSLLIVNLPDGTYDYTAVASGYNNVTGSFVVKGHHVNIEIHFTKSLQTVKFLENGLPHGTMWWVNISGVENISSSNNIAEFTLHNGHYSYSVSHVNGYMDIRPGNFTVDNHSVTLHLHFVHIRKTLYMVSFIEFLPPGVDINLTVNDKVVGENDIELLNGTYDLTVNVTGAPFNTPVQLTLVINGSQVQVFIIVSPIAIWIAVTPNPTLSPPLPLPPPMNPSLMLVYVVFATGPHFPQTPPLPNPPQAIPSNYFESTFFFIGASL